jgi:putative addiction module component (TIGR02574 family)
MNTNELIAEIKQLDLSEKILLVEDIWDSVAAANSELPMPQWQKQELDSRYKAYQRGETELHDWKDVHQSLRKEHQ